MNLITSARRQKLLENGRAQRAALDQKDGAIDFEPVVKLFTHDGNGDRLFTELNPDVDRLAFGLFGSGLGEPELGYVSLHELAAALSVAGLRVGGSPSFSQFRDEMWYKMRSTGPEGCPS